MAGLRTLPRGVLVLIVALLLATIVGLVLLWPDGSIDAKLDNSLGRGAWSPDL